MKTIFNRRFARAKLLAVTCALFTAATVRAAEIKVVTSGAFTAAYLKLVPEYERAAHHKLVTEFGPSMGTTHNAIPLRLERGEAIDVVIMAAPALAELMKQGKVQAGSRVDLVESRIGMAVKAGAPKPDIGTVDALKRTLLNAKSIAYSDSASGVYLSTELFPKLGIADQIRGKSKKIEADPVGEAVARGEIEIGFQQISELIHVPGVTFVGPIPAELQPGISFAGAITSAAREPDAALALLRFLASPEAASTILKAGLTSPAGR